MARKGKYLQVRVTDEQFAAVDDDAKRAGQKRSDYLRGLIFGETPTTSSESGTVGASSSGTEEAPPSATSSPGAPTGGEPCEYCGGTDGRHQSFCEAVTGEPPVITNGAEPPQPEGTPIESPEDFIDRRELELKMENKSLNARRIAEAEWRRLTNPSGPLAQDDHQRAIEDCYRCGTQKTLGQSCPECGARPL